MSILEPNKPEIQKFYQACYRTIRLHRSGRGLNIPAAMVLHPNECFPIFISALTSHDHRHAEFSGWLNPLRHRYFLETGMAGDHFSDIPF